MEYPAITVPLLGLALTIGAFRHRRDLIGSVIFLASVGFAGLVAIEGNRRPIASLLASTFLALAVVAGEKQKGDALALAYVSVGFVTLMITALTREHEVTRPGGSPMHQLAMSKGLVPLNVAFAGVLAAASPIRVKAGTVVALVLAGSVHAATRFKREPFRWS